MLNFMNHICILGYLNPQAFFDSKPWLSIFNKTHMKNLVRFSFVVFQSALCANSAAHSSF